MSRKIQNKRTYRKKTYRKEGGFIVMVPTITSIGVGLLLIKRLERKLTKKLHKLSSSQLKELVKKISPKKKIQSDKRIISYILSRIKGRNKKTKGIKNKLKHKIREIKKRYKLCKIYLKYIEDIKK